jgi:hypothetical protein
MTAMFLRRVLPVVALAFVTAGCASSGGSASPAGSGASSVAPAASASVAPEPSATATTGTSAAGTAAEGQTDTDWGRIWDAVPADFPRFAGSTAAEEGATGPASATLAVPGDVAQDAAWWMSGQLKDRGYAVDGDSAALEDGSFVLDATHDPDCRVGVTIAPTGGVTTITVLYGAGCPKP